MEIEASMLARLFFPWCWITRDGRSGGRERGTQKKEEEEEREKKVKDV